MAEEKQVPENAIFCCFGCMSSVGTLTGVAMLEAYKRLDKEKNGLFCISAEYAFTYVEKLVEGGAKRVTLMHAQDRIRIEKYLEHQLNEFNRIDRERLERLQAKLQEKGATDVRIELPYGSPVKEILKQTKEAEVSLVVMGSQGRGFISEVFLGSVSHNVARHAPVSVLLIPAIR